MTRGRRGQVIVLVTLALIAMCGLMGLAVDLGWSFYIEKTSQAAADSAALAAVIEVLAIGGKLGPYDANLSRTNSNGGTVEIAPNELAPVDCPPDIADSSQFPTSGSFSNKEVACLYAARNGFSNAAGSRQNVRVSWGDTSPPPEVQDVDPVYYWTTVWAAQSVPQLFSAVLGNTEGLVASKATAAIIDSEIEASLILLNREMDCVPLSSGGPECGDRGTNLLVQANQNCPPGQDCTAGFSLRAGGGVVAASEASGTSHPQDEIAAIALGNSRVESPSFKIKGAGTYFEAPNADFDVTPLNGFSGSQFEDPFEGVTNPPLPDFSAVSTMNVHAFPGGTFPSSSNCTEDSPCQLNPGIYVATGSRQGVPVLTGDPISLPGGYYQFVDTGAGFNDYIFIGGLHVSGANVSLAPGRYAMLGARGQGSNPGQVFSVTSGSTIDDGYPYTSAATDAGQLYILGGPNYPNSGASVSQIIQKAATATGAVAAGPSDLGLLHGTTDIQLGNNDGSLVNIHGLSPDRSVALDSAGLLDPYRRVVMWQDKDNSRITYDSDGRTSTTAICNASRTSCTVDGVQVDPLDYPIKNISHDEDSVELRIQAAPGTHIYGIVYQGRGTYTYMQGGGGYSGPIQIITGAFRVQGNAMLDLGLLPDPVTKRIVALIQ